MSKKRRPATEPVITKLIIPKKTFKEELKSQCEKGKEIIGVPIQKAEDINELNKAVHSWFEFNLEHLKRAFNVPYNEYRKKYNDAGELIGLMSGQGRGNRTPQQKLKNYIDKVKAKISVLENLHDQTDLLRSEVESNEDSIDRNNNQVFIVHGHDDSVKEEMASFIEALGFEPIILHKKASSGMTIIEKIDFYSNVGFGIVLYTPCDLGAKKGEENKLQARARQNVVFEHGYIIGKLKRENVCAVVKGNVEKPNDISGVVYVQMENDWKLDIAKELQNSGYNVDFNRLLKK